MSMYVLQVVTGREEEICSKLRKNGIPAYCPQAVRKIRRGGRWLEQTYTLYPAYIFVQCESVIDVYYAIRREDGVLYWLGATRGTPEPLHRDEEANILWLTGDGPLPVSKAVRRTDGGLDFTSGPLKRLVELEALRSVLVRERRATAALPLHGIEHKIKLSFELEQETGSSDGAGSPPEAKAADIL